ncbi:MAG: SAM-dependent methyltransferase [Actinomycetota bacterium]|nr:SAM-dependent methyltransferase [Actinomycetota bacterium]
MTDAPPELPGVDPSRPSVARVYDYLLGGTDNFAADRAAAEMLTSLSPELVDAAFANRSFHRRAARWIAGQGVGQFIDLGSGLPAAGNTHDIVREARPGARVAYVDNDPMVLAYGRALLGADEAATVILGDLRDPGSVLGSAGLRGLIDFTEPVGLLVTAVLHFVSDESDPAGLIAAYAAALAPGSYVALSHMTGEHKPPKAVQALTRVGAQAAGGAYLRSRAEVRRLFGALPLVPPYPGAAADVTWVGLWNCEDPELADSEGSRWLYCGVARTGS